MMREDTQIPMLDANRHLEATEHVTPVLHLQLKMDLLISHHTGAQLMTLFFQIIQLMNWIRH